MKAIAIFIISLLILVPDTRKPAIGNHLPLTAYSEFISCEELLENNLDFTTNTIYSPAFRAAWTMLKLDSIGEDIKTRKDIPLVDQLNKHPFPPSDRSCWVIEAGSLEDGIIERIKQSLMYKFKQTDPSLDRLRAEKGAVICFSRYVAALAFQVPFETLEWRFHHGIATDTVACFGITKKRFNKDPLIKAMQEQVSIYDYRSPDDFIVRLSTADPSMELILAKIEPDNTLGMTVSHVFDRMDNSVPEDFSNIDELIIPKLKLDGEKRFPELIHQSFSNKGFKDFFISEASLAISLSLDESGAVAQATGEIIKIKGPESRIYAFDKPFLVILRQKDSPEPDLVAWVANSQVMQNLKDYH